MQPFDPVRTWKEAANLPPIPSTAQSSTTRPAKKCIREQLTDLKESANLIEDELQEFGDLQVGS